MRSPPILLIPAFNEEARLGAVLDAVRAAAPLFQVVVVDDGSDDATATVARRAGARVLRHPFNLGYGAALQTGYKYALEQGAQILVQMDADGQHDPRDAVRLAAPLLEDESDLVIGSRFLGSGYHMSFPRNLGRRLFSAIARLFALDITDPTSGFQAMNRRVLQEYARDSFPVDYPDVNVLIAAHRSGLRLSERSVHMSPETRPSTLHGGLRSVYYVYMMLLSTWTASGSARRHGRSRA